MSKLARSRGQAKMHLCIKKEKGVCVCVGDRRGCYFFKESKFDCVHRGAW